MYFINKLRIKIMVEAGKWKYFFNKKQVFTDTSNTESFLI